MKDEACPSVLLPQDGMGGHQCTHGLTTNETWNEAASLTLLNDSHELV